MITRRTTFNLDDYLYDLKSALEDRTEHIHDEVQRYRDFLSHTKEPLLSSVKKYVGSHPLVSNNQRLKSFIDSCYR